MHTIFYSWQSDLTSKYNRSFIETCLNKALKNLHKADDYLVELNLDRDTKDEPGTPDIVATIFKKISIASIFICDISIINQGDVSRKTPNPNVLLELGFAASVIGWDNIICVYNTAFGIVEDLPFDLKFRRPLLYQYSENNEKDKDSLIKQLEAAIKAANPELAVERKKIKQIFSNESSTAIKLAIEKPDFWEFKLCEELVRQKLENLNSKHHDINRGVAFIKPKAMNSQEFLGLVQQLCSSLMYTMKSLIIVYQEDLTRSFGLPGVPGNAVEVLQTVNKIFSLLENFLDWEITVRSISVSSKMEVIRGLMEGASDKIIKEINTLPDKLKQIYLFPEKSHNIELVFETDLDEKGVSKLLNFYTDNPDLLLEN